MTSHPKAEEARTFADWAGIAIAKHSHKMLKHETAVLKDKDPEELHQMRVGMRRLRSAIVGFNDAIALPAAAKENKVGKIAKILGELRDLDVLVEALETQYQPTLPHPEQQELALALKSLKKRRKEALERVRKTLNSKTYTALKKSLAAWLEAPEYRAIGNVPIATVLPDLLLPEISKLLLHPGWFVSTKIEGEAIRVSHQNEVKAIDSLLNDNEIALHDLRKEAKRARYQLELFEPLYGENYARLLQDIKAMQEILGDIQDSFVLAAVLEETLEEKIDESMPVLSERLLETRHQRWQTWQTIQQTFLERQHREEVRLIVMRAEEFAKGEQ